jgi:hypothetical protein
MLDLKSSLFLQNVSGWNLAVGAALTWSVAWCIPRLLQLRVALKGINYLPGDRYFLNPLTILGRIIPFGIPYINRKPNIYERAKRVGKSSFLERINIITETLKSSI